jgi:hypothetical protein
MMTKKRRKRKKTMRRILKMRDDAERSLVLSLASSVEWPQRTNPIFAENEVALHAWTHLWKPVSRPS